MAPWTAEDNLDLIARTCGLEMKKSWADIEKEDLLPPGRTVIGCRQQLASLRRMCESRTGSLGPPKNTTSPSKRKANLKDPSTPSKGTSISPQKKCRMDLWDIDEEEDKSKTEVISHTLSPASARPGRMLRRQVEHSALNGDDQNEDE